MLRFINAQTRTQCASLSKISKRRYLIAFALFLLAIISISLFEWKASAFKVVRILPVANNLDSAVLSVDGSHLFALRVNERVDATLSDNITHRLEVYDVKSSSIIKNILLPNKDLPIEENYMLYTSERIKLCDRGKLLLIYLDKGDFTVLVTTDMEKSRNLLSR
jgi:hypothetical protein